MSEIVSRQSDPDRYEISVDGVVAGFAEFADRDGSRYFTHTEIDSAYGGRGFAGLVVKAGLDEARALGLKVVAECSYVAKYLQTHVEYSDIADTGQ